GDEVGVHDEGEMTAIGHQLPATQRQTTGEPLSTLRGYEKVTVAGEDASRDRHAAEAARKVQPFDQVQPMGHHTLVRLPALTDHEVEQRPRLPAAEEQVEELV